MIKRITLVILLAACVLLSGCTIDMNKRDISSLSLIHCLGVDYENGEYTLTAVYDDALTADEVKYQSISGKGKTLTEAFSQLERNSDKRVVFTHTNYYIISEKTHTRLSEITDFLDRYSDIRLDALLFAAKDISASELLEDTQSLGVFASSDLDSVREKTYMKIKRIYNTTGEVISALKENRPIILMAVEKPEKTPVINGCAVFYKNSLKDFLDSKETREINLAMDNLRVLRFEEEGAFIELSDISVKSRDVTVIKANAGIYGESDVADIKGKTENRLAQMLRNASDIQQRLGVTLFEIGEVRSDISYTVSVGA